MIYARARFDDSLGQIELEFVEREAIPQLLMKLSIQLHLQNCLFQILFLFLMYLVSNGHMSPFTIGYTRKIYSPTMVDSRITLRSMRP